MLQQINTIEEFNKIRTEIHSEWCKILDYQMKQTVKHGLWWALCSNYNVELEQTLKTLREKEQIISKVWNEKFSFEAMIKKYN